MDDVLAQFHARLLAILHEPMFRVGTWSLLQCVPNGRDNTTSGHFIAFRWERAAHKWMFVAVNYSPPQSQCLMCVPFPQLAGRTLRRQDLLDGGRFLDWPAGHFHVFDVQWLDWSQPMRTWLKTLLRTRWRRPRRSTLD
ncbi:hypothetical protein QTI66_33975 [Variovorax sp. J22R133]|uniref:hypothetical protein n=1 Tax=Variovorax brevis TaxID=3053503 RepID=UPI002578C02C|nr:hypothetical protein [Variovorax sp. J22R133]MDM0117134.1 hypothetical protein [Variovorax sp. J22R133]